MKKVALYSFALVLVTSCILTKPERRNRRASKKLDNLIAKYPQLVQKDTIRDTVSFVVPEIKIDTVIQTSKDVSYVDTIISKFDHKIDSLTSRQLKNEIKYYITKRQVIEDTITHVENGVTVKIWQSKDLIRISVFKPKEEVLKPLEIPVEKIVKPEPSKWEILKRSVPILLILTVIFALGLLGKIILSRNV